MTILIAFLAGFYIAIAIAVLIRSIEGNTLHPFTDAFLWPVMIIVIGAAGYLDITKNRG